MKKHITIDASVLMLPDHSCSQEDVFNYIENLIELNKLLNNHILSSKIILYCSIKTSCLMINKKELTSLLKYHHIEEYDPNTLIKIVFNFKTKIKSFEDFYQLDELKYDHMTLNIKPNILKYDPFCKKIDTAMISLAILNQHKYDAFGYFDLGTLNDFLLIKKLSLTYDHPKRLYVTHSEIEYNDKKISLVNSIVPILDNIKDVFQLFEVFDICDSLKKANNEDHFKDAIQLYLIKKGHEEDIDILHKLTIGSDFLASCHSIWSRPDMCLKIIRAIIDSLKQEHMSKTHALRINSSGGSPPKTRSLDRARAQRRDIDDEFHLHYWQKEDKEIEVSNVVLHNDFTIYE